MQVPILVTDLPAPWSTQSDISIWRPTPYSSSIKIFQKGIHSGRDKLQGRNVLEEVVT